MLGKIIIIIHMHRLKCFNLFFILTLNVYNSRLKISIVGKVTLKRNPHLFLLLVKVGPLDHK